MDMSVGHWYMTPMPPPPTPQSWGYPLDIATLRNQQKRRQPRSGGGQGQGQAARAAAKRPTAPAEAAVDVTPLYKTKLCNFYVYGARTKGSRCPFAHGNQDLWPSPDFEKTSVCPTMLNEGVCDKPNCRYAHAAEELRASPGLLKTKMCSFYLDGLCVVGQACRFAHSAEELQDSVVVQNAVLQQEDPAEFHRADDQDWRSTGQQWNAGPAESWESWHVSPPEPAAIADVEDSAAKDESTRESQSTVVEQSGEETEGDAVKNAALEEADAEALDKVPAPGASKSAVTEELSQVASAMKRIFLDDDDDDDVFGDFDKKAGNAGTSTAGTSTPTDGENWSRGSSQ